MNKICDIQGAAEPCKDPAAVKDAIMELDSPASSAHWAVFSKDVKSELMYSIMYWMAKREYPAATIRSGNHWVVVIGFDANADPLLNSDVELPGISSIHHLTPSPNNLYHLHVFFLFLGKHLFGNLFSNFQEV